MLLDHRAADGSRQFLALPQSVGWHALARHVATLRGVEVREVLTDDVTEAWIDFAYEGHSFTVNNQFGEYWFFVGDPECPDTVLLRVANHCSGVLV